MVSEYPEVKVIEKVATEGAGDEVAVTEGVVHVGVVEEVVIDTILNTLMMKNMNIDHTGDVVVEEVTEEEIDMNTEIEMVMIENITEEEIDVIITIETMKVVDIDQEVPEDQEVGMDIDQEVKVDIDPEVKVEVEEEKAEVDQDHTLPKNERQKHPNED